MIKDRSPLKHSVHKVCVPNLHIAHFLRIADIRETYSSVGFWSGIPLAVTLSAPFKKLFAGKI
jgi:hypothetical protein